MTGSAATTWACAHSSWATRTQRWIGPTSALRCTGTVSLGHDLAGRARMKLHAIPAAVMAFENAVRANRNDTVAADHLILASVRPNRKPAAKRQAEQRLAADPSALVPRAVLSLDGDESLARFADTVRAMSGRR